MILQYMFVVIFVDDHSRVILKDTWDDGDNDYINANFIKVKYIAFISIDSIFFYIDEHSFSLVNTWTCFYIFVLNRILTVKGCI